MQIMHIFFGFKEKLEHRSFPAPGDDLELVELQSEDAARVLDEGAHAQRARRRPRVQRRRKVPHLKENTGRRFNF